MSFNVVASLFSLKRRRHKKQEEKSEHKKQKTEGVFLLSGRGREKQRTGSPLVFVIVDCTIISIGLLSLPPSF